MIQWERDDEYIGDGGGWSNVEIEMSTKWMELNGKTAIRLELVSPITIGVFRSASSISNNVTI